MILADKIINERKKNGWSQEELAEMLNVSRQSVSKWESAQATPDLQKLLKMSEIFGVTTDYLLKDDMEEDLCSETIRENVTDEPPVYKVSMEEANEYISVKKQTSPKIAIGVALCILCPVILIWLTGWADAGAISLTEDQAAGLGLIPLFILVASAVAIFILQGTKLKKFEHLKIENIDTAYGVDGMAKEKRNNLRVKQARNVALGTFIIILSIIPLVVASCIDSDNDALIITMTGILLIGIAIGVFIILIHAGESEAYKVLLQEEEFAPKARKHNDKYSAFTTAYWCVVTAAYLLVSFLCNRWDTSWLIWPVAGVLFGGILAVVKAVGEN